MNRSRFQFSLRALLLIVTIAAVAVFAVHKWRTTRLVYLVEEHVRLVDAGEFSHAADVADLAMRLYPKSDIAQFLATQSEVIRRLQNGEDISEFTFCRCYEDSENFELNDESKAAWDELSRINPLTPHAR